MSRREEKRTIGKKPSIFKRFVAMLQKLGKSLLFPIAMLPFAAIFLRVGAEVPTTTEFASVIHNVLSAVGNAVFDNLAMLFAIGIAFGLANDNRGEAAITGFVVFLLFQFIESSAHGDFTNVVYGSSGVDFHTMFGAKFDSVMVNNVLAGIVAGSVVAFVYNNYKGIEMPSILGFFSGRRLVPVLGLIFGLAVILLWSIIFPWVGYLLQLFSEALVSGQGNRYANAGIMGVYGTINRLLIPFGLHHVPNTLFWFSDLGGHQVDQYGQMANGDIFAFLNGVPAGNTAGTFQSGFFPIMMFGLPALAAAMWFRAKGDVQKARVATLFAGSAIVSFFTGITEPIEFTFVFMAPALFGLHAVLTGLFGFVTGMFGIQLGFGFSAGLIDYALSIPKSMSIIAANKSGFDAVMANPAWIWVIGAAAAGSYFFIGSWMIKKFNLNTPGRGSNLLLAQESDDVSVKPKAGTNKYTADSKVIIKAVGGKSNIKSLGNCATRLRFVLKDNTKVDKAAFKKTKAVGSMKVSGGYQVIMGPTVEMYADEINEIIKK